MKNLGARPSLLLLGGAAALLLISVALWHSPFSRRLMGASQDTPTQEPITAKLGQLDLLRRRIHQDLAPRNLNEPGERVVIINFWASWCPPCKREMPSLLRLVQRLENRVDLVAISADNTRSNMDEFLRLLPLAREPNVFLLFDANRSLMEAFGVEKLPETFIFAPNLTLAQKVSGGADFSDPKYETLIKILTAKKTAGDNPYKN